MNIPSARRLLSRFSVVVLAVLAPLASAQIKESVDPLLTVHLLGNPPLDKLYPLTTTADPHWTSSGHVFVACGPTVVSNLMRYWSSPRKGAGTRTFTDAWNCTWSADFANTEIRYDLALEGQTAASPAAEIDATATLLYLAGTAMHDVNRTGNQDTLLAGMKQYLRFSSNARFANRDDYTPAAWEQLVKTELSAGRPLIVEGWGNMLPDGGHEGHWYICDGYNKSGLFHIWWGSTTVDGQRDQWLPLYSFAPYHKKNWMLIGLEPDWAGKTLELTAPAGNEVFQSGTVSRVGWRSSGVNNLQIEYSTDKGATWSTAAASVAASAGSWNWTVPPAASNDCKLRITDTADINVYRKTAQAFSIYSGAKSVAFASAPTGRLIQQGATVDLTWTRNGVSAVTIGYSLDGGATWTTAAANVTAGNGVYRWTAPAAATASALVRLSDATDSSVAVTSGAFSITPDNVAAAQLAADANTVALFHFEGDLANATATTGNGSAVGALTFGDGGNRLGQALRINNTAGGSCMTVPASTAFALSGDWTIQFWMKVNSTGGTYTAYPWVLRSSGPGGGDDGLIVSLNNGDRTFSVSVKSAAGKMTSLSHVGSFEIDKWYHLALVGDAAQSKLLFYLQDQDARLLLKREQAVAVADLTLKDTGNPLILGGASGTSNVQFDGWIDELQLVKRAVDPTRTPVVGTSRLVNIATRGTVPAGGALTPGFVLRGSGSKQLLIRAVGPTLGTFGVGAALTDPQMSVVPLGGTVAVAANDNWGGSAALRDACAGVGAFPLVANSLDAVVQCTVAAAGYTVRITPAGTATSGIALAEVYDPEPLTSPVRLVNVSTLGFAGAGESALTPGFVIRGNGPKQLLIRAIGPGLAAFGVGDLLADPQIRVTPLGETTVVASNDNWGGTAALKVAFTAAGAFALADDSRDAAVIATLMPGGYTVQVSGVGNLTGNALVEIYDLDP